MLRRACFWPCGFRGFKAADRFKGINMCLKAVKELAVT